jgi:hypothetical protein
MMDQVTAENVLVFNADSVNFELVNGKQAHCLFGK